MAGMIRITAKSSGKTDNWLRGLKNKDVSGILNSYGEQGAAALASATPADSGLTASSWTYEVVTRSGYWSIIWHNTNMVDGFPVAIALQYGHGTGTGGYVQGRDYIMPAIRPLMDSIADAVWKVVTS